MAFIEYTAKRSLAGGHSVGERYMIELEISDFGREVKDVKTVARSPGGGMETILDRQDTFWQISLAPVCGYEVELMREFLDSTESGETFRVWLWTEDSAPLALKRVEESHSEGAFMRRGSSDGDYFEATFEGLQTSPYDPAGAAGAQDGTGDFASGGVGGFPEGGLGGSDGGGLDPYLDDPFGGLDVPVVVASVIEITAQNFIGFNPFGIVNRGYSIRDEGGTFFVDPYGTLISNSAPWTVFEIETSQNSSGGSQVFKVFFFSPTLITVDPAHFETVSVSPAGIIAADAIVSDATFTSPVFNSAAGGYLFGWTWNDPADIDVTAPMTAGTNYTLTLTPP